MIQRISSNIKKRFLETPIRCKVMSIMVLQNTTELLLVSMAVVANIAMVKHKEIKNDLASLADIVVLNASSALVFGDKKAAQETRWSRIGSYVLMPVWMTI